MHRTSSSLGPNLDTQSPKRFSQPQRSRCLQALEGKAPPGSFCVIRKESRSHTHGNQSSIICMAYCYRTLTKKQKVNPVCAHTCGPQHSLGCQRTMFRSLLPHVGPGYQSQAARFSNKLVYQPSHLTSSVCSY